MTTDQINFSKYASMTPTPLGGGKPPESVFIGSVPVQNNPQNNGQNTTPQTPQAVLSSAQNNSSGQIKEGMSCDCSLVLPLAISCSSIASESHVSALALSAFAGTQQVEEDEIEEEPAPDDISPEEFIEDTVAGAERGLKQIDKAIVLQFPKWVQMYKVAKIRNLQCFELVREMLLSGSVDVDVARCIQAQGELTNVKLDYLRQCVQHYKATIPKWDFIKATVQKPKALSVEGPTEHMNPLQILEDLSRQLFDRVNMLMANDKKFGLVSQGGEKTFEVALRYVEKLQAMQESMGVFKKQDEKDQRRQAPTPDWAKVYGRESVARVMEDPEKRVRVLRTAERLLDLYAQKVSAEDLNKISERMSLQNVKPKVPSKE